MVNRLKLNEKTVREAENLGRDYQIFDTDVRGFSITIYPSGNRAFTLDYRIAGRQRRMTIGRWPEWNTVAARERAKELRRDIDEGIDPLSLRETSREAPRVNDMITRYLAEHTPHLAARNAADQHTIMHKLVAPDWGNKLVTEITKADVEKLLTKIAAGRARPSKAKPNNRARKLQGPKPTPVRANRVGEALRKMFTLAIGWGMRADNPASGFRRRIENERERFLTPEEIGRLAKALDAAKDQRAAGIIRLCMLTGARSGEVRQARFEQFNLDLGSWSKPAATTKQRKIHRIPISGDVAAIVRQRSLLVPRGNPWLFPGDTPGQPVTFGVTLRTAQRMSRALEEAFPMVQTRTDKERRKWWQLRDSRLLHMQGIRDSELSALEMGIRRAERDGAATEVTALTSLRNRLLGTMPPTFARRAEVDAEAVLEARGHACRPGPRAQYSALVLGAIDNALKGPFTMQIDYAGAQDAAPRWRAVEPYGVLFGMRGYLIAREIDNGGKYRHFRLDRISRASLLKDSFVRDPDFDLGQHAARAFGSFHSEAEYGPVEWRFAPSAADVARTFIFHPDQQVQDEADGSLTVRFTAGGWLEMAWHLYQWGAAVEVIAPHKVRALVEAHRRSDFPSLP